MAPTLILNEIVGDGRSRLARLESDEVLIGREPSNGVKVGSQAVSREHGRFVIYRNHWFYKDLGSTNGSWLNGAKVEKGEAKLLKPGDVLQLADVGIEISKEPGQEAESPGPRSMLVLSRGSFLEEYPIPEFGRALVVGGSKADLKLDVDIYELPSLVIERRGSSVCAYQIAREVPAKINGKELTHTVMLGDRDELEIAHYVIVFNDVPEIESAKGMEAPEVPQEQAAASSTQRAFDDDWDTPKHVPFSSSFGRAIEEEERRVDQTVALDPNEVNASLAGFEAHPSRRFSGPDEEEEGYSFEALENKILIGVGIFMFVALIALVLWWLLPAG